MAQGSRPARVAEEIRQEVSQILARDVHDPGVGFVTLTRVTVSPDLQLARVYYTQLGDEKAKKETARALVRVTPFVRREIGKRIRLRRVPEVVFHFDEGVEHQANIERIILEIEEERARRAEESAAAEPEGASAGDPSGDPSSEEPNADGPDENDKKEPS